MRVWDQYIVNIACPLLTGTVSEIDQLSWGSSRGSRGHGEAKCMLGFQVIGQHITFYLLPIIRCFVCYGGSWTC
ncbi:unnamed protein product [Rhizophagus irregularis]|nr:unnamed protein product [Rhizophagus irregularis]